MKRRFQYLSWVALLSFLVPLEAADRQVVDLYVFVENQIGVPPAFPPADVYFSYPDGHVLKIAWNPHVQHVGSLAHNTISIPPLVKGMKIFVHGVTSAQPNGGFWLAQIVKDPEPGSRRSRHDLQLACVDAPGSHPPLSIRFDSRDD